MKRRAHTQNPKNETEIQNGRERERTPNCPQTTATQKKPFTLNHGPIFTGEELVRLCQSERSKATRIKILVWQWAPWVTWNI